MNGRSRLLLALLVAGALPGCSGSERNTFRGEGISFDYPQRWHVTGFSTSNSPPRLAVTSYPVPENAVEGDCGGLQAVEQLPPEGALVLLIDYGEREHGAFPPRPPTLTLRAGAFAEYECFGASTMFRFRLGARDFQAHVAFGGQADEEERDDALAILASLTLNEQQRG